MTVLGVSAAPSEVRDGGRDAVVAARGLVKCYDGRRAVDGLDLTIRRGEVYGLLGRNGAGKTTTMRMLLGLVRPTAGNLEVLGGPAGRADALRRTGALIEGPAFYPHLSGADNLALLARMRGLPTSAVADALASSGLGDRAATRYRGYSLGMKQRLGIAAALLGAPDLLVLDEPTNGLDPAGTADVRDLVRSLGAGGRTVVLSSHLLSEVEQVCTRIGVVDRGRLVAEGTAAELRERFGASAVVVDVDSAEQALALLDGHPDVLAAEPAGPGIPGAPGTGGGVRVRVPSADPRAAAARINRHLVAAGLDVHGVAVERRSLEEVFLSLTHGADEPA